MTTTEIPSEGQWDDLLSRLLRFGVLTNVVAPLALLAIAWVLTSRGGISEIPQFEIINYVLVILAIAEIAVATYLRKAVLFRPPKSPMADRSFRMFSLRCQRAVIILSALAATPALYGMVLVFLGGSFPQFVLFLVIGLFGFRLLRPSKAFLQQAWEDLQPQQVP